MVEFGQDHVLSLTYFYGQRNATELKAAAKISRDWGIQHNEIAIPVLQQITSNALTDHTIPFEHSPGQSPNTLVVGRNGLMAHVGGIYCHQIGCGLLYMGVEELNSGYRDCSRYYMDLQQEILRLDLDNPNFEIRTPLIHMVKSQTLELAKEMGILDYLLKETVSCYEGIPGTGCGSCPSCVLRKSGLREFDNKKRS